MADNNSSRLPGQAKSDQAPTRSTLRRIARHGRTDSPGLAFCLGGSPLTAFLCGCSSAGLILAALAGRGVCPLGQPDGCPIRRLAPAPGLPPLSNTGASPVESSEAETFPTDTNDER